MTNEITALDSKFYKKHSVVLTPTENSKIHLINGFLVYNELHSTAYGISIPQNLHILSDEEIKENDWVKLYVKHLNKEWVHQVTKADLIEYPNFKNEGQKIIASTDKSLTITIKSYKEYNGGNIGELPRPSNEFLKAYCEQGGIDEVLVEYECDSYIDGGKTYHYSDGRMKLKVAPDNTITIKPVKEKLYTRAEVIGIVKDYALSKPGYDPKYIEGEFAKNYIK